MRKCSQCKTVYRDDTLNFCLDDGARLLTDFAGDDTVVLAVDALRNDVIAALSEAPGPLPRHVEPGNSIAVLPFTNMSADAENEYFCDGLAEELLNALSKINELRVAARTSTFSFKGKNANVREIAHVLNVANILEGSVRKSGDRIRITAQLVNAENGYHIWSEKYDRRMKDIFDVQDEISLAIVNALKLKLAVGEDTGVKRYTENTQAYQLYLMGRYYLNKWTGSTLRKAIECFSQASEIDPDFALAYSGLADCYSSLSIEAAGFSALESAPKARAAALKALALDDALAEAHTSLALVKMYFDWDWPAVDFELRRAIELDRNYVAAYHWYSHYLIAAGRLDESEAASQHALVLDPLDLEINAHLAWHYYSAKQFDKAEEQAKKTIEMDPNFHEAHWFLGCVYLSTDRIGDAIQEFHKAYETSNKSPRMLAELAAAYGRSGKIVEAKQILNELSEQASQTYISAYNFALIYSGMRDIDNTFGSLEMARDQHTSLVVFLKTEQQFAWMRNDPRFSSIIESMGLAQ